MYFARVLEPVLDLHHLHFNRSQCCGPIFASAACWRTSARCSCVVSNSPEDPEFFCGGHHGPAAQAGHCQAKHCKQCVNLTLLRLIHGFGGTSACHTQSRLPSRHPTELYVAQLPSPSPIAHRRFNPSGLHELDASERCRCRGTCCLRKRSIDRELPETCLASCSI